MGDDRAGSPRAAMPRIMDVIQDHGWSFFVLEGRAVERNSIRPAIDRSFPLEALGDAFRYQESGKHFGKIGIDI
jgi:hypothetical protein